jgi:DNA-binding MarR family transcriptional regulator
MEAVERELDVLESIHSHIQAHRTDIRQRDLARVVGISLGMTNAILARLIRKGWLQAKKVNQRNIQYLVSPKGVEAIARRSYRYLKRTIKNVVLYKEALEQYVAHVKTRGFEQILLEGSSDLEFILAPVCLQNGIQLCRNLAGDPAGKTFILHSENEEPARSDSSNAGEPHEAYLRDILINC